MIDIRKYVEIVAGVGGGEVQEWVPPVFEYEAGFALLLESGKALLLEDGEPILSETNNG